MNPTVRLVASIIALTALGGCSFNLGGAARTAPQEEPIEARETPFAPAEAATEASSGPASKDRASWVPAHWEMQGRSKTWVDGHWG